jgi:hypothetical protein
MAKVTGPLFSVDARGTLGDVLTYQKGFGRHRVTRKPGHRDAESGGQLSQRGKFLAAIAYWKALTAEAKAAYNAIADAMQMTGYQYVLKLHMLGRLGEVPVVPPEGGFAGGLVELAGVWLQG